jgi:hypothetical protein
MMKMMKMMKINVSAVVLMLMFLLVSGQANAHFSVVRGDGKVITQDRNTSPFSAITVSCSADVYIRQGNSEAIKVKADEDVINQITTNVSGGVLEIDVKGNNWNVEVMEVYVTVKNLEKVVINGSGDVKSDNTIEGIDFDVNINGSGDVVLDLNVKSLETKINGSGDVKVSGVQGNFNMKVGGSGDFIGENLRLELCEIEVNGSGDVKLSGTANLVKIRQSASGDVNLFNLPAENVEARTNGSGDVVVFVNGSLKANLGGSGDITYKGEPKNVDVSATGSGEVYHR